MTCIMIVEDEFIVSQDLTASLKEMGHDVCGCFEAGEQVMTQIKKENPDLVIMDIMLKGHLDGIHTAQAIHDRFNIPVVFLTAFADKGLINRAKLTEPYGYLIKPFTNQELHSTIEIALYKAGMEKKLRASEKRFKEMADLLPSVICETDPSHRILFINKAGRTLFELLTSASSENIHITDFFHPEDKEAVRNHLSQVLDGGDSPMAEYRLIDGQSNELTVILDSAAIRDEKNAIVGARSSIFNITDLKKLQLRLGQAWKMDAIATLAGGVAHEFNNALTGVTGHLDLMKMQHPHDPVIKKYLDNIMASVDRMADVTKQVLAYARGGKYQPRFGPLNDFVEISLASIKKSISEGIQISIDLSDDVLPVLMDDTQFQFVLSAVITNACEAMSDKGRIHISTQNKVVLKENTDSHPGLKPGSYACLQIKDDGPGMDDDTRRKVFEPFFSTKFPGRGMGMAAVYGIIKNHGGWVGIDTAPDSGTTVSLFLPAIED